MTKHIEITKSKDKNDNCNTCHNYGDIYRIKFNLNPSSTIVRLCDTCIKELNTEIELTIKD